VIIAQMITSADRVDQKVLLSMDRLSPHLVLRIGKHRNQEDRIVIKSLPILFLTALLNASAQTKAPEVR
jgi:hypothetical protein